MKTLGVDIGGANIKLADSRGSSLSVAFPMWNASERLGEALKTLLSRFKALVQDSGTVKSLAVTMTGELADCFMTRREGVAHILQQVAIAAPHAEIFVYAVDGSWLSPAEARQRPWDVAASNWHALAQWLIRSSVVPSEKFQLMVDVGSTTVDIIPVDATGIATHCKTDRERLQAGQLVYTGMQRTPVAAILNSFKIDAVNCPLMAERFATSDDAYLALGLVAESAADHESADGRPRTKLHARSRLARMVGEDGETLPRETIDDFAEQIVTAQASQVAKAIERNLSDRSQPSSLLISGHGRPLVERIRDAFLPDHQYAWLDECTSAEAARCGPALAVAWLLESHQASAQ